MQPGQARGAGGARLNTWKAISEFLGKDERTAKRWERTRGMPVHRVPGGGSGTVHAYVDELKRWRDGAFRAETGRDPGAANPTDRKTSDLFDRLRGRVSRKRAVILAGVAAVGASALLGLRIVVRPAPAHVASPGVAAAAHAPKPAAVELYRQGRYEWNRRTPESLRTALADFTQAAVIDPDYAEAYAGLADSYNLLREYSSMPADQAYPAAAQAAEHALALDDGLADAHASLAFVKFHWSWDVAGARREFERAIALDPHCSDAEQWYATALLELGAFDEALRHIDRAEALAPESASIRADKGLILVDSGRTQAAEATLRQLVAADPHFLSPHDYLADLYFIQRRYPEYLKELQTIAALRGDEASRRLASACDRAYRTGGEASLRRARVETEQALYGEGKVTDYQLADAYALDGDADLAVRYLAMAVARHSPGAVDAVGAPEFRFLRGRADYQRLRARLTSAGDRLATA